MKYWPDEVVARDKRIAELEAIVKQLEPRAAFGDQCWQDQCENAYVEASVVKRLEAEVSRLRAALENGTRMHMYYWEDPAQRGYDYVAIANSEENARGKAVAAYEGPPEFRGDVEAGLQERPTGIFHFNSAIEIFTERDPEGSLACHQEWDKLRTDNERLRAVAAAARILVRANVWSKSRLWHELREALAKLEAS